MKLLLVTLILASSSAFGKGCYGARSQVTYKSHKNSDGSITLSNLRLYVFHPCKKIDTNFRLSSDVITQKLTCEIVQMNFVSATEQENKIFPMTTISFDSSAENSNPEFAKTDYIALDSVTCAY